MATNASRVARALVQENGFHLGLEKLVIQRRRLGRGRSRLVSLSLPLGPQRHGCRQEQTRYHERITQRFLHLVHRNLRRNNLVGKITKLFRAWGERPSLKQTELQKGDLMGRGRAQITHPPHVPLPGANAATSSKALSTTKFPTKLPSLCCGAL